MNIKKIIILVLSICFIPKANTQTVFNNVYNDYSHITLVNTYNGDFFSSILNLKNGNTLGFGFLYREDTIQTNVYGVEVNDFGDTIQSIRIEIAPNTISKVKHAIQLPDSSVYLVGFTTDNVYLDGGNIVGLIVKLDKDLNYLWHKDDYNIGSRNDFIKTIYSEPENMLYIMSVAHNDTSSLSTNLDAFISKIDTSGNLLNTWQFGSIERDGAYDFEMLEDHTFILSGGTFNNTAGSLGRSDMYILKVDTLGNTLWEKKYGYPGTEYANGQKNLYVDSNYMLVAGLHEKMNGDYVGWLLKLDMQGDTLWSKMYEKALSYAEFKGIEKWDNESFLILGAAQDTSFLPDSKPQAWLIKIDTLGNKIWERLVGAYPEDEDAQTYVYDYEFAPDRGILLTGYVINNGFQENGIYHRNDAWLAKTDSCGYTVGDIPEPMLIIDSIIDKTVYITDQSTNYCTAALDWGDGTAHFYSAYENNQPLAEKHFSHTYGQTGDITIRTTALAGEEFREYEVQVLGLSNNSIGTVIPAQAGISLFPNPANDYIIVQNPYSNFIASANEANCSNPADCFFVPHRNDALKMTIYSINGEAIPPLGARGLNSRLYQQKLDVSSLNNGVYFVRFEMDGVLVGTEKLVVAR